MALDAAKNFAKATLSTGYDAAATTLVLAAGGGGRFPATPFNAVWWNATDFPDPSDDPNVEVVRVTGIATDTLTVTRAQEGTGASSKNTSAKSYKLIAGLTAKAITTDLPALTWPFSQITSVPNGAADGATKGVAAFAAADFNASAGVVSIDYLNGQAADATHKGFLTAADWITFTAGLTGAVPNSRLISTTAPLSGGGDLTCRDLRRGRLQQLGWCDLDRLHQWASRWLRSQGIPDGR